MLALTPLAHVAPDVSVWLSVLGRPSEVATPLEARRALGAEVVVAAPAVGEARVRVAHALRVVVTVVATVVWARAVVDPAEGAAVAHVEGGRAAPLEEVAAWEVAAVAAEEVVGAVSAHLVAVLLSVPAPAGARAVAGRMGAPLGKGREVGHRHQVPVGVATVLRGAGAPVRAVAGAAVARHVVAVEASPG